MLVDELFQSYFIFLNQIKSVSLSLSLNKILVFFLSDKDTITATI